MGKPKGMLESEIRIAMLLLEQRPPRYAGAGRVWSIAERERWFVTVTSGLHIQK